MLRVVVNAGEAEVRRKSKFFVRNLSIKLRTHVYILRDENNVEMIRELTDDESDSRKRRDISLVAMLSFSRVRRRSPKQNRFDISPFCWICQLLISFSVCIDDFEMLVNSARAPNSQSGIPGQELLI